MDKKQLRNIPIKYANNELISFAKSLIEEYQYILITAEPFKISDADGIELSIYLKSELLKKKRIPKFRIFATENDYISQSLHLERPKWLTSCFVNLIRGDIVPRYCNSSTLFYGKDTINVLSEFLKSNNDLLSKFESYQNNVMEARWAKKEQETINKINSIMSEIPELPDDWQEWLNKTAIASSHSIFYEYKKNQKSQNGICTFCNSKVKVTNAKHNKSGICPNCNNKITYRAIGRKTVLHHDGYAYLLQKAKSSNELWLRGFYISSWVKNSLTQENTFYIETYRWRYKEDGNVENYEIKDTGGVYHCGQRRWTDVSKNGGTTHIKYGALYESNITECIENTIYKYSALKEFATHIKGYEFLPHRYIWNYPNKPYIEYLTKLKLFNMAEDCFDGYGQGINKKAKGLEELLGVNKSLIPLLQEINPTLSEFDLIKCAEKNGIHFSANTFNQFKKMFGLDDDLIKVISEFTTLHKMMKYFSSFPIEKNTHCHYYYNDENRALYANMLRDYLDYIGWCKELKYDLKSSFVLFPKNFKQVHDETHITYKEYKDKQAKRKLKHQEKKYQKQILPMLNSLFNVEDKEFTVVIPNSKNDLDNEGKAQHHCVASYSDKVLAGTTYILFIRKKNDINTPYYTCEINPELKLVQCRGKSNSSTTTDVDRYVRKLIEGARKNAEKTKNMQRETKCA